MLFVNLKRFKYIMFNGINILILIIYYDIFNCSFFERLNLKLIFQATYYLEIYSPKYNEIIIGSKICPL